MKKILFTWMVLILFSFYIANPVFARHEVNLPEAGLTPLSSFYFIDQLGEKIKMIFTFNFDAKADLLHSQSLERVAEVREMLETKGVDAPGIQIALFNLNKNSIGAGELIKKIKNKGEEVSTLAKEINANFHEERKAIKAIFENAKEDYFSQKDLLIEKFKEAVLSGDFELAENIKEQLKNIDYGKNAVESIKDSAILKLESEKKLVESELDSEERFRDETELKFEKLEEESEKSHEIEKENERKLRIEEIEKDLNLKKEKKAQNFDDKFLEELEKSVSEDELELEILERGQEVIDKKLESEEESDNSLERLLEEQ